MNNRIADQMKQILLENDRISVWYGDTYIIEECAFRAGIKKQHPLNTIQRILNALDRSDMFKKGYISVRLDGNLRKYRCFTLISHSSGSNFSNKSISN